MTTAMLETARRRRTALRLAARTDRESAAHIEKLLAMLDDDPVLGNEQPIRDAVLNEILRRWRENKHYEELLERWKLMCGADRNISNGRRLSDFFTKPATDQPLTVFGALAKGGKLCLAAESAWLLMPGMELSPFLSQNGDFTLYRSLTGCMSAFAWSFARDDEQSLHHMRLAAERGLLDHEPREELLSIMKDRPGHKMLVLSLGPMKPYAPQGVVPRRTFTLTNGCSRNEMKMETLRSLWQGNAPADECRRYLSSLADPDPWFNYLIDALDDGDEETITDAQGREMVPLDLAAAACIADNPNLLCGYLETKGFEPETANLSWRGTNKWLSGPCLCAAAAAGRVDQARYLLENGADPSETGAFTCENGMQLLTPLALAEHFDWEEVVSLLREYAG